MVDASPTMSAARLSRVIEKQTGVPQGSFSLYYGSRPMYGTLAESGVASGSTIELKSRGRGGGPEPPATSSSEVEIERPSMSRMSTTSRMMHSYDRDGDGKFSRDEVRAMAADFIKEKKTRRMATKAAIAMGLIILLVVGLNAGLTAAIVFLSKDVKVVSGVLVDPSTNEQLKVSSADTTVAPDGSLRDQKANSVSVSTHTQKNVYAVKLVPSQRRLDEQGSGSGNEMMVAQVACKNVLAAIASIEHGDDTGLVRIDFGNGDIWLPALSAASYHMQNDSFGMEQIFLSGRSETLYDVVCETTRLACDTNPGDLCDVVISSANPSSTRRALSFEEAFDGDLDAQKISNHRRLFVKDWQDKIKSTVNSHLERSPWFRGEFGAEPQKLDLRLGTWMHWIGTRDDTHVASMLIPGTHDTEARHGDIDTVLGDVSDPHGYAKNQDLSLRDQLDAGIRALDIRVKFEGCGAEGLKIYHGSFYQKTNWLEVKQTLEDWITSHPTEFVLVFVQNENPVTTWTCRGLDMHDYLFSELDASKWYMDAVENPTYGNFKGRLVFFKSRFQNRFYTEFDPVLGRVEPVDTQIQDNWNYVTRQQKWDAVEKHEAEERQSGKLYINMLSAAPTLGYELSTPAEFALFINERAYNQIDSFQSGSGLPYSQIEPA